MKYIGMPMWMWVLFSKSFRDKLISVFGYGAAEAGKISKAAKARYQEIIAGLPEFEKADRFRMNIVNCASRHGEKAGCGEADRLLCTGDDDTAYEMVLPFGRKAEIQR